MNPTERTEILESLGSIKADLANMGQDLTEIKVEVKRTNGRVTRLETREQQSKAVDGERKRVAFEKAENRQRWNGWFAPIVSGTTVGILVLLASMVITGQF